MTTKDLKDGDCESDAYVLVDEFDDASTKSEMVVCMAMRVAQGDDDGNGHASALSAGHDHIREGKHHSSKMDDNSSTGGWSEVSLPSSFRHSSDGYKSKQSWNDEERQAENGTDGTAHANNEKKHDNDNDNDNDNNDNNNSNGNDHDSHCGSDLQTKTKGLFSWAEITKIQPSFQNQDPCAKGLADDPDHQLDATVPLSSAAAIKKSIVVAASSQDNVVVSQKSSADADDVYRRTVAKTDPAIADKENLELNLRRPGKKRLRFKHSSGSRRNSKKNYTRKG